MMPSKLFSLLLHKIKASLKKFSLGVFIAILGGFSFISNLAQANWFRNALDPEIGYTIELSLNSQYEAAIDLCQMAESYSSASNLNDLKKRLSNFQRLSSRGYWNTNDVIKLNNRALVNYQRKWKLETTSLWNASNKYLGSIVLNVYSPYYFIYQPDDHGYAFYSYYVDGYNTSVKQIAFYTNFYGKNRNNLSIQLGGAYFVDGGSTCVIYEAVYDNTE